MAWLAGLAAGSALAQPAALPQRNLLVQWRWVERVDRSSSEAAMRQGSVTVGTGGQVDAHGTVVWRSGQRQDASQAEQQLLVLNGGRATLAVGQRVPLQWVELGVAPDGPAAVVRQAFTEAGSRFEVQPRWPGGSAPVVVEVVRQVSDGSSGSAAVTTLRMPMDQWMVVARDAADRAVHEQGVLSSRDAERRTHGELQMKISAP